MLGENDTENSIGHVRSEAREEFTASARDFGVDTSIIQLRSQPRTVVVTVRGVIFVFLGSVG